MIEENITTGRVSKALPTIRQKLNGYLRHAHRIKIGATTNPEARWRLGHGLDGWGRMVLLYESEWPGATRSMERALIQYAREANFLIRPENVLPGGESIPDDAEAYWVYIIVDN